MVAKQSIAIMCSILFTKQEIERCKHNNYTASYSFPSQTTYGINCYQLQASCLLTEKYLCKEDCLPLKSTWFDSRHKCFNCFGLHPVYNSDLHINVSI